MLARKKPKPLPPAPAGLGDFWAIVHVKLTTPIPVEDDLDGTPVQGYYRTFGIRSAPSRVHIHISGAATDGAIDWEETEWSLVNPANLDPNTRARIDPIEGEGIWYMSGRAFYADPDLEVLPS